MGCMGALVEKTTMIDQSAKGSTVSLLWLVVRKSIRVRHRPSPSLVASPLPPV